MSSDIGFNIENINGDLNGHSYDKIVTFFNSKGVVEGVYYYYQDKVNWLISWGFSKGSLNESRKQKAKKVNKPFFSLQKGWFNI